jgi:hypothetical protein
MRSFDSAPPQSTLDEINDTNDLDDEEHVDVAAGLDGLMLSRTKSRRDSTARFGGLKEQLRDLPHGAAYSDNDSASDTGNDLTGWKNPSRESKECWEVGCESDG